VSAPDPRPEARIFTPFELNGMVNAALEDNIRALWIEGELTDVSERNGHVYFALRDARASVRGVIFSGDVRRVRHLFEDGRAVRLKVTVGVFVPRGTFQIRATVALPAGEGDRAAEVERIRKKLSAEGLLSPERKRPLPAWPKVVGLVTSRAGAAVHDILEVARSRMPVRLVLAHASVQGIDARDEIIQALRRLSALPELDVVIVARGGGASEDLSAFDDERVARAVAAMRVPVVSGVGHEIDVTTVDLVADVRAATPSYAAEQVLSARGTFLAWLTQSVHRMEGALRARLSDRARRVELGRARLSDPSVLVLRARGRMERAEGELRRLLDARLALARRAISAQAASLDRSEPRARLARTAGALSAQQNVLSAALDGVLARERASLSRLAGRIDRSGAEAVAGHRAALAELAATLSALSPLGVLGRGYAIALHEGRALKRPADARPGDPLELVLAEGRLRAVAGAPIEEEP
jgi:exodeoxyribonuclease VII large subunit